MPNNALHNCYAKLIIFYQIIIALLITVFDK